jgi:WXXGXW repeat (2 copies)
MKHHSLCLLGCVALLSGCVFPARSTVVVGPPPAAIVEVVPASPGPGYYWVRGHWGYSPEGRYVWIHGHYVARRPGSVWVEGRYENRNGGYVWVEGYWR